MAIPHWPTLLATARVAALAISLGVSVAAGSETSAGLPDTITFNRDVRPIMSNTCFKCHGPDVRNNKSDLRLDLSDVARAPRKSKSGRVYTPIVPGDPDASEVWRRIVSDDPLQVMPPKDSLHQLSVRDKAVFKRWIEQGARYDAHWAYILPVRSDPPALVSAAAVRNTIDRFILAALETRGIAPSSEAGRRTLIRRASLDLTGLPPSLEAVEAFVADSAPDAYERRIDRLLASPHYGERMAVPWLDLVRFADSVGFHGDQLQNIFPYRDYVIDAFNRNLPFDRFTLEQLAGDLLPNPTTEQRIATGFNRLNMMTREGGAQPKEYLAKYAADRVRTVSTAWLGSTVGCAECHDHKFDPIPTKDFYQLAAYFADIKQWGVYTDYEYTPEPELAGFNVNYPFPPEIEFESPYLVARAARLRDELDAFIADTANDLIATPERLADAISWAADLAAYLRNAPDGWHVATPVEITAGPAVQTTLLPDKSVRIANTQPDRRTRIPVRDITPVAMALQSPAASVATFRLEVLPDEAAGGHVTRNQQPLFNVRLAIAVQRAGGGKPEPLAIANAYAECATETYFNGQISVSVCKSWRSARQLSRSRQSAVYLLNQPVALGPDDRLIVTLTSAEVSRVRVAVSPLGLRLPGESLSEQTRAALIGSGPKAANIAIVAAEYFKGTGSPSDAYAKALKQLQAIAECRDGKAFTMVTEAAEPRVTRVLSRGNWQDESGEIVLPAPPTFQSDPGKVSNVTARSRSARPVRQTRLDLARWLTSPENPLTARTFVNRLWKQFFGTGLSAAVDDLGMQGEYPSHPELLDWLAVEFMENGWNVKAMVRLIVTSATYRQSSVIRPELMEIDPHNRLLSRQNPLRLDAEFVRDNALFAAGLLNLELGGPSVRPYQPDGYYAQMNFPIRTYQADRDERQYRRGVYMQWQRTFLHPMLANFDAPSREECSAMRNLSNTPQQALTLLNDPTFVEAARTLAERALEHSSERTVTSTLGFLFRTVLARPPTEREVDSLRRFIDTQLEHYRADLAYAEKLISTGLRPVPEAIDPSKLAAWTSVARVVLNLNETIVRY